MKKPELVCPAGDWPSLCTAVENGADSVYFGVKNFNMRNLAVNFDMLEVPKIMRFLHQRGRKGYLALNVLVKNEELKTAENIIHKAKQSGVDAVILWDMALFSMAKTEGLKIHVSTQAGVLNRGALGFYRDAGAGRVILGRESFLSDVRNITDFSNREEKFCETEVFIHGAMCVSVSGRCFLSAYSFGKSANKGECIQPCRRQFSIKDVEGESEYVLGKDYVLSPKDLCTAGFIDKLIQTGVSALKIEGRGRAPEYIKVVVSAYRELIDSYFDGFLTPELKKRCVSELSEVYNRGFSSGFYFGTPEVEKSTGTQNDYHKVYVGEVKKFFKKISVAEISVIDNQLSKGDTILIIGKKTPARFAVAEEIQQEHHFVDVIPRGQRGGVKLPFRAKPKDKVFLWRKKELS